MSENPSLKTGYIYALLAYVGWGFFPIYWKFLQHIPPLEILCHRVIWAFAFYTLAILYRQRAWRFFWPRQCRLFFNLSLAAVLIMANWFVYIYAVNSGHIVESSLGYFINPLVNIALGVLLLKERLSLMQKIACAFAAAGVIVISWDQAALPWIALFLAFSFSFYGLIKKLNAVSGLNSNQFESSLLLPAAFLILFFQRDLIGVSPYPFGGGSDVITGLLLAGGGIITGLPLVFFAEAAQRLPYYLLGFFQFLAPTLQFMSGVLIFKEPMSATKLNGFILIWVAGLIVIFNGWLAHRARVRVAARNV